VLDVYEKVKGIVISEKLISRGSRVVVGVSGGPDSMTLAHVLLRLRDELGFSLHVVHVDHELRGEESDGDRRFVEEWCYEKGIPLTVKRVDVEALATERSMSVEEAGRAARQAAFAEAAEHNGIIALAHNLEDQAETILMRILRGTGTDGLAGMSLMRDDGAGHTVIRPLLGVSRAEIEKYCEANGIEPRRDSTNSETKYHRNLLRHRAIPFLDEIAGASAAAALVRLGRNAAEDKEYFAALTDELLEKYCSPALRMSHCEPPQAPYERHCEPPQARPRSTQCAEIRIPRAALAALHPAVRHRLVRRAFERIGLTRDISAVHLAAADDILSKPAGGKSVDFPGGYRFALKGKDAIFLPPQEGTAPTRVKKRS
jgi:tRNA(Ile)-lysidine synthase